MAVLLHDIGLARDSVPDRRFEVVGADVGRAFALAHDMGKQRAETVWDAIALHTTASIGRHKGVDVACSGMGIGCDYGGFGYQELGDGDKETILSAYPRLQMKEMMTTCLSNLARSQPNTTRTISSRTSARNTCEAICDFQPSTCSIKHRLQSRTSAGR